jgi:hypothetical protein
MARRKATFKLPNLFKPKKQKKGPLQKLAAWNKEMQKYPYGRMGWW